MNRVVVMAGGTGGHIFPALSVAEILRASGCQVTWMGSRGGMEESLVPRSGFEGDWISIRGFRGKGIASKVAAPFRIMLSIVQAMKILIRRQPAVVLGMGGFASGPGGFAAWLLRRPIVIHEQNAIAGTTNRILSRLAHSVFEAFPNSFTGHAVATTVGNPVREEILALEAPELRLNQRQAPVRILVLGGSQGALVLNQYVPAELVALSRLVAIEVRHQAGANTLEVAQQQYTDAPFNVQVDGFIDDMASAYGWADLVICRAGALTVSELACAGLGSVLIPFPFAIDDHQTANARYLVNSGAARLLPQSAAAPGVLVDLLLELVSDRNQLLSMAVAARSLSQPAAAQTVAQRCMQLVKERRS